LLRMVLTYKIQHTTYLSRRALLDRILRLCISIYSLSTTADTAKMPLVA